MSSRHLPAYRFLIGALAASSMLTSALATLTLHVETPLSQPAARQPLHGAAQPAAQQPQSLAQAATSSISRQ